MSTLVPVGRATITAAGGSSQAVTINNKTCRKYWVVMSSVGAAAPAAGTTAVSWKPSAGDTVTMKQGGIAVNVNPTDLQPFTIACPVDAIYFTPSSWTANSALQVQVYGEVD